MTIMMDDPTQVKDPTPITPSAGTGEPQDWRADWPDELKQEKSLESFKDSPSLARSYVETKRLVGDSLRLPKTDASPEDRQKFLEDIWGKLGRPASATEYGIGEPELPEGMPWDTDAQGQFLTEVHRLGLTKEQAEGVLGWYVGRISDTWQNGRIPEAQAKEMLRSTWGSVTDRNIEIARRASALFGPKLQESLNATGMGNDPDLIRQFYEVGRNLVERGLIPGQVTGAPSEEEIRGRINAIRNDPKHPYNHPGHPDHERATEEYWSLWKILHPQEG